MASSHTSFDGARELEITMSGSVQVAVAAVAVAISYRIVSPLLTATAAAASSFFLRPADSRPRTPMGVAACGFSVLSVASALHAAEPGAVRILPAVAVGVLTWKGLTTDYDLRYRSAPQQAAKLLLVPLGFCGLWWPALLLLWAGLACGPLVLWQHHTRMSFRLVKGYVSFALTLGFLGRSPLSLSAADESAVLLLVLSSIVLSQYAKPAWSKARLGPHWWSWALHNRTHFLLVGAYNWGWARFLPEARVLSAARLVRKVRRPLQVAALFAEAMTVFALFNERLLVLVVFSLLAFHVVVALTAGILFWESAACVVALSWLALFAPQPVLDRATGVGPGLVAIILILAAARGWCWHASSLGWWDGPLTDRVYLEVETATGSRRHLPNFYMCPYEREFGRFYGYVMSSAPVAHGPLGGLFDRQLLQQLIDTGPHWDSLQDTVARHGKIYRDDAAAAVHAAFLMEFFSKLNAGRRKGPLVGRARWLKAPGGQLFYWGEGLTLHHGEEWVRKLHIRRTVRFYDERTNRIHVLADETLRVIEVPDAPVLPE